jgi:hypothetical protein
LVYKDLEVIRGAKSINPTNNRQINPIYECDRIAMTALKNHPKILEKNPFFSGFIFSSMPFFSF